MGAIHVTVAIRNPAEPDRVWEGLFSGRHGRDRLPRAQAAPGIHRPRAGRGSESIRAGRRQRKSGMDITTARR